MKNEYLIIGLLSSLLLMFVSCEDILDKEPLDKISNDAYWKKSSDLDGYVVQFYPNLVSGGYTSNFGTDASSGSDNAIYKVSADNTMNGARAISTVASTTVWNWSTISSINTFFENCNKCEDDPALWKHYLGEAYFFRAWQYFSKVKSYGDVPIYKTTLNMSSPELYNPRDKRTDVVDFILDDLDQAIENLNYLKDVNGGSNRLSKEAALIFKSRVALYEGSWQKYHKGTDFATEGADYLKYFKIAYETVEELQTPGKYTVGTYGNSAKDYGEMFGQDDMSKNSEVVLWKAFNKDAGLKHELQAYTTKETDGRAATLSFVQSFLDKNGEPFDWQNVISTYKGNAFLSYLQEYADPRLSQTIWMPGDLMCSNNKYGEYHFVKPNVDKSSVSLCSTGFQIKKGANPLSDAAGSTFGVGCETGLIVFRYAEALLNYAEAKYEYDGNVDYDKSINLLRRRVGMPDFKVIHDSNAKQFSDYGYEISDELFEIRRERRVELGQEGYRTDDYKRWAAHKLFQGKRPLGYPFLKSEFPKAKNIYTTEDGLLDPFNKVIPNGYKFDENRDYLDCIPTNEITLNPKLLQNPGW